MFKNIAFVGGIHGVGKGTICTAVSRQLKVAHLTASEILSWKDNSKIPQNKRVHDVSSNQDRLVLGLERIVHENEVYILDGHYCLFNSLGAVTTVPLETFRQINPGLMVVITGAPEDIAERLMKRDGVAYSAEELDLIQTEEIRHAIFVSNTLKIPFYSVENTSEAALYNIMSTLKLSYESSARY
jgi:adenylate kinase